MASPTQPRSHDWIGPVPSHWSVVPIRFVARLESGHTPSRSKPEYWVPEECTIPWVSLADVWQLREGTTDYIENTAERVSEMGLANSSARLLPRGTVILSRTASVGFSGILAAPMATTQDFVNWVCGPRVRPEYLLYVFRGMTQEFKRLTMGSTHQTIYMPDVRAFRMPLPPLAEQDVIVSRLRTKLADLDDLIRKKKRLIELLREKRHAFVTQAVTEGLDANVARKNSGVPWLGEIPTHWVLSLLMHLTPPDRRIMYGIVLPGSHVPGGVPIVKGGDVKPGRLRLDALSRTAPEIEARYARSRLAPGDLVFTIRGGVGDVEVVPNELDQANLTQDVARVSPAPGVVGRWLLLFLRSHAAYSQIEPRILGATIRGINIRDLKRVVVPVPPRDEQRTLADVVGRECDRLDAVNDRIELQIARLREYREALISAEVTGRADVTSEAAA